MKLITIEAVVTLDDTDPTNPMFLLKPKMFNKALVLLESENKVGIFLVRIVFSEIDLNSKSSFLLPNSRILLG